MAEPSRDRPISSRISSVSMISLKFFSFVPEIYLFDYKKYFNIIVDKIQGKDYYQVGYVLITSFLEYFTLQTLFRRIRTFFGKKSIVLLYRAF